MNERSIERVEQQKAGGICGAACAPDRVISQQLCCGEYLLTRLNNHSGLRPDGGDFYTGDGGPQRAQHWAVHVAWRGRRKQRLRSAALGDLRVRLLTGQSRFDPP